MAEHEELKEAFVSEVPKYDGKVFSVGLRVVRLPSGREADRELVYHKGAAAVVPVDGHGMVTLVRQYRVAHDAVMLEIPAGKLDSATEDPLACAHRELLEETGLKASRMELLTRMIPTPGYCTEFVNIYLATGLTEGCADPDEDEFLSVERMPLQTAAERVMRGELGDAKTAIGLLMAARLLCR
ncbi:MAG: NUDIX hydrolase [Bacillota bacterium]